MTRRGILLAGAAAMALPACRASDTALDAQVLILGAGLSGLYAAMLLEEEGYDVQVVEALDRVGGRMFTLDHGDGYTEGGGQQIGASYARVLNVADQLGVPLYHETGRGPATAHYLNGEWSDGAVEIPQFPDGFQNTPPSSVLFQLLRSEPGLAAADSWLTAPPEFDISAAQFLTERGFSSEAQALIDHTLNGTSLGFYSMLNLHRTWQLYTQSAGMGPTQYVEGGSQRLPEAMMGSLNNRVILSTPVRDIEVENNHVNVSTDKGLIRAEHVVCTLPFPVLRQMSTLFAALPRLQKEAIEALPYTVIKQFHMRADCAFWEEDRLSPSHWSETPTERTFADTGPTGDLTGFHRGWVNGTGTSNWAMNSDIAGRVYVESLNTIRPATRGALSPLAVVDWTETNPYAGGAYYHWAPGQASRWGGKMGQPIGRLHFAGEHLGILHTGMEAAMESAERAALGIIEGSM